MASISKMAQYRQLGACGLRVSVPIMGTMSYGTSKWMPWILDADKALPIMKAAWDRGINTFDTANIYSNGESERVIAKFIKTYNIPRNQIIVATKCNGLVENGETNYGSNSLDLKQQRQYINQYGLSRAAIFNAVEASLERLETTYIDLLQIHRLDATTPVEETMKALHDLIQAGKVRYIGASSMRTWQFARMNEIAEKHGWTKFVSMQNEYSLLYREEEREMIPYCKFHGIGIIPWGPLSSGLLSRPYGTETTRTKTLKGTMWELPVPDSDKEILKRVEEVAKRHGKSMAQVSLAWVGQKIDSPIIGVSSVERLEESVLTDFKLSREELEYLEEPYQSKKVRGHM